MSALSPVDQVDQLIAALDDYADVFAVITLSNADAGGQSVSKRLVEFAKRRDNVVVRNSLGHLSYAANRFWIHAAALSVNFLRPFSF